MRDTGRVQIATKVAWSFHGLPYKWGGNDPMAGFDCSGFCIEILQSVNLIARGKDYTAHGLWTLFQEEDEKIPKEGCLVFWHKGGNNPPFKIIHVEYCLNDELSIGASGGGGSTITEQDAIEQDAYIKVRAFRTRGNLIGFRDPFML